MNHEIKLKCRLEIADSRIHNLLLSESKMFRRIEKGNIISYELMIDYPQEIWNDIDIIIIRVSLIMDDWSGVSIAFDDDPDLVETEQLKSEMDHLLGEVSRWKVEYESGKIGAPSKNAPLEAWFEYRANGAKITLAKIAEIKGYSYDYVRHEHAIWRINSTQNST